MVWAIAYLAVVAALATGSLVTTGVLRRRWVSAPDHPRLIALLGAFLWPAIVLGVVQVGLLMGLRRVARRKDVREVRIVQ